MKDSALPLDPISTYLAINADKYPKEMINQVSDIIKNFTPEQLAEVNMLKIKDPTLALLLSFFFGSFAVDRFYLGNIGLGIIKLLTIGGFGIWTIVDWFLIMKSTRKQNFIKLTNFLAKTP